ncbi:hypothetical protein F383_23123 [Gossypium arboreum]|uniref:Uncharacterized protein n=1 Tax=Gossypium arboreum TaxID=29729 RepID=A0A0B0P3D0_GOSAR|nr:hypothetical protein F383_23123 [Gossypium arboreum]
MQNIYMLFTC